MNYRETLKLAKANHINICELLVADEVACVFGLRNPCYERICEIVYQMYMKTEGLTANDLANSLREMLDDREVTLTDVCEYGEGYDLVIENACYLHV